MQGLQHPTPHLQVRAVQGLAGVLPVSTVTDLVRMISEVALPCVVNCRLLPCLLGSLAVCSSFLSGRWQADATHAAFAADDPNAEAEALRRHQMIVW